jgi:Short C-terminal domain
MNQQMTSMMGGSGEARAHTFMGQRFAGCATGSTPAVFATMMGMMGGYASANGNGSGSGMMGGSGVRGSGHNGGSGDNDWGTGMVVLMGLVLAAGVGALAVWRPWQRSQVQTPLDLLGKRYASGEIDGEEYERRRQALGGED